MTFEEKKQEIISELKELLDMPYWGDIDFYQDKLIAKIKELQPDKPTCSTCKYFFNNDGFSACTNKKCEDVLGNISVNIELNECRFHATRSSFGCIYHDKA